MAAIPTMALDLLCHLTIEPKDGLDPEQTAELVASCWQTHINDLSDKERTDIVVLMKERIADVGQRSSISEDHETDELESLQSFIDGEMV